MGKRFNYIRTGDNAWQPYDLILHSEESLYLASSPKDIFFFASSDQGASRCFFEVTGDTYRVGKTKRDEFGPFQYWPGFWEWLFDEINAAEKLYRSDGTLIA